VPQLQLQLCVRGHFRSNYKDGGHTIRSTIFTSSIEPELLPIEV